MATVLTSAVAQAVAELEEDYEVDVEPTGDGGAIVTVHDVDLGDRWTPHPVDVEFQIAFNYPHAAIYPYFVRRDLARTDGAPLPAALQHVEWRGRPMTQVSLRANKWNPDVDTARGAVGQVARWFRELA